MPSELNWQKPHAGTTRKCFSHQAARALETADNASTTSFAAMTAFSTNAATSGRWAEAGVAGAEGMHCRSSVQVGECAGQGHMRDREGLGQRQGGLQDGSGLCPGQLADGVLAC